MCHVANVKVQDALTLKDQAVGNVEVIMSRAAVERQNGVCVCVCVCRFLRSQLSRCDQGAALSMKLFHAVM